MIKNYQEQESGCYQGHSFRDHCNKKKRQKTQALSQPLEFCVLYAEFAVRDSDVQYAQKKLPSPC